MNTETNAIVAIEDDASFQMRRHEDLEQGSLFPIADLIIPSSLQNFKKSVSAIHAVPIKGDRTLNIMRLVDACIIIAQLDFRNRESSQVQRIRNERITPLFEAKTSDLARLANIQGKNYQRIYNALDSIFEMVWMWNIVGEDSDVQWEMKSHFFSELGYGKGYKKGYVRFSFPPAILEFILEPKHWATLSLNVQGNLGSEQAYALYQNTWRYINTHAKVTASLQTSDWIRLLCGSKTNYIKQDKDGKETINYGDFKRRTLLPMMQRVNEVSALGHTLRLIEHRKGNRVARLQFKFVEKDPGEQAQLKLPLAWPADVLKTLDAIGYTNTEIQNLSEGYSLAEISDALTRLPSAQKRLKEKGIPITNIKSYFEGILGNISGGAKGDEIDPEKIHAEMRRQASEREAADRHQRLEQDYGRYLNGRFIEWLSLLPDDKRGQLFGAFGETDRGKPLFGSRKGWESAGSMFSTALRLWLKTAHPDLLDEALPRPEDKSMEAWLAWRLDQTIPPE